MLNGDVAKFPLTSRFAHLIYIKIKVVLNPPKKRKNENKTDSKKNGFAVIFKNTL